MSHSEVIISEQSSLSDSSYPFSISSSMIFPELWMESGENDVDDPSITLHSYSVILNILTSYQSLNYLLITAEKVSLNKIDGNTNLCV